MLRCLAIVGESAAGVFSGEARGATPITAATVIAMDPRRPRAEAVALKGETIVAVGPEEEVRRAAGDIASRLDLGDRALLPGFIDAHHHYCLAALDRRTRSGALFEPEQAIEVEEALRAYREHRVGAEHRDPSVGHHLRG